MSSSEAWSARRADGFALAATAQSDRGGAAALPGLAADIAASAAVTAGALAVMDRVPRRRWLKAMLAGPTQLSVPMAAQHSVPARALGLLATSVDRELGRNWLDRAPRPRPGWSADPRLIARLRELVSRNPTAPREQDRAR
jgi:hypothetical protein